MGPAPLGRNGTFYWCVCISNSRRHLTVEAGSRAKQDHLSNDEAIFCTAIRPENTNSDTLTRIKTV
jgi:hypothetical protein